MELSKRLCLIFNWIQAQKYKYIWDVGSDHGALPLALDQIKEVKKIWASDISLKSIENLNQKTKDLKKIQVLFADGLKLIKDCVDVVVISGLGTRTILNILKDDNPKIKNYILQTNCNLKIIREWCNANNFLILKEKIIFEKKYYYHNILISKAENKKQYKEEEIFFGPELFKKKDKIFLKYWNFILSKQKELIINLPKSIKKTQIMTKNKWIKQKLKQ